MNSPAKLSNDRALIERQLEKVINYGGFCIGARRAPYKPRHIFLNLDEGPVRQHAKALRKMALLFDQLANELEK